jgi:hypothetical protein
VPALWRGRGPEAGGAVGRGGRGDVGRGLFGSRLAGGVAFGGGPCGDGRVSSGLGDDWKGPVVSGAANSAASPFLIVFSTLSG